MQGTDDTVVPPSQSVDLADRLRGAGDSVTLIMVSGAQHELGSADQGSVSPSIPLLANRVTSFLLTNLGYLLRRHCRRRAEPDRVCDAAPR